MKERDTTDIDNKCTADGMIKVPYYFSKTNYDGYVFGTKESLKDYSNCDDNDIIKYDGVWMKPNEVDEFKQGGKVYML